ncbi:MAG: c-type cytochrome biogenesis protein CcmI [Gammaproteobacteria bacterium]|nr:c-type cytochrome biogenesis protein CcmI [Gammaproteobacteria bacterium]
MIAALMVIAAAASVVLPLVWLRRKRMPGEAAAALDEHKRALEKLDAELAGGRMSTAAYRDARAGLERAFQERLGRVDSETPAVPVDKPRWKMATFSVLVMLALVSGLYASVGNWRVAFEGMQKSEQNSVEDMVAQLAHRLATTDSKNPKDWMMLGQSYVVLGRYADAVPAYAHAYTLSGDSNPDLLADYAEAIILADPGKIATDAAPLLTKALQAAPDNPKALWYGGLLAIAQHNKPLAIQRWQKLLAQNPPSGIRQLVEKQIQAAGGSVTADQPASATGNPVADDAQPQTAKAAGRYVIPVHVSIAPQLAKMLPADSTLFVFVRPIDNRSGPPLLATRMAVEKLPADLELTDADAMMPGTSLSSYKQVDVVARVSLKGGAEAQPGDLQGTALFKFAGKPHTARVVIDKIIR